MAKSIKELEVIIEALAAKVEELEAKVATTSGLKPRDRGPESTRDMTDDDARKVIYGELKDMKHKDAAKVLGLSYGQVYSARGVYTFKNIHAEAKKLAEESEK